MIDTDKYEGHTEGPWSGKAKNPRIHSIGASGDGKMVGIWYGTEKVEREDPNEDPYESIRAVKPSGEWTDWARADATLIADAPLILEDYKRLREELDETYDTIQEYEEVIEPNRLNKIERLERALKSNGKYNAVVSATGNAGGGSIMVNVMFDDGEEYYGILDKVE
tara:strand:- start:6 stop:503 length:498 start_codon:yes stop_codon:yes gene_type:complete